MALYESKIWTMGMQKMLRKEDFETSSYNDDSQMSWGSFETNWWKEKLMVKFWPLYNHRTWTKAKAFQNGEFNVGWHGRGQNCKGRLRLECDYSIILLETWVAQQIWFEKISWKWRKLKSASSKFK